MYASGEYEGSAQRRRDTCIRANAVIRSSSADAVAGVPDRELSDGSNPRPMASAPLASSTEVIARPGTCCSSAWRARASPPRTSAAAHRLYEVTVVWRAFTLVSVELSEARRILKMRSGEASRPNIYGVPFHTFRSHAGAAALSLPVSDHGLSVTPFSRCSRLHESRSRERSAARVGEQWVP